jgi:hypothetical protein
MEFRPGTVLYEGNAQPETEQTSARSGKGVISWGTRLFAAAAVFITKAFYHVPQDYARDICTIRLVQELQLLNKFHYTAFFGREGGMNGQRV